MRYTIRDIEAWRCPDGWTWNNSMVIAEGIDLPDKTTATPRALFRWLRDNGYPSEHSIGRVRLEDCWPTLEVQDRSTYEPILALIAEED
jgi:hypothetical protein